MHLTDHPAEAGAPTALILPGADYPAHAPLLYWAQGILRAAGWRVIVGAWENIDGTAPGPQAAVDAILDRLRDEATVLDLIVGKSLGSFAAPRCVAEGIAGVWLTPLLNVPVIARALSGAGSDHLLIGGTRDRHWLPEELSDDTTPTQMSIPGAGHSLRIGSDWRASLVAQQGAFERIEKHIDLLSRRRSLANAFLDSGVGLRRGVVEVTPSSDAWGRSFLEVRAVLASTAPEAVAAIEHIGSTSVPRLDAKPILDIAIGVQPGTPLESLDDWLIGHGMLLRGDANDARPDRMYGFELEPMIRLVNVHVLEHGSRGWRDYLSFRDHLRAHPDDRDAYAALKRSLAVQHPGDRLAYIAGKEAFVVARR